MCILSTTPNGSPQLSANINSTSISYHTAENVSVDDDESDHEAPPTHTITAPLEALELSPQAIIYIIATRTHPNIYLPSNAAHHLSIGTLRGMVNKTGSSTYRWSGYIC
jgi:hypothetical protein